MQRLLIVLIAASLAGGCSSEPKPLDMAATLESSRTTLTTALDEWKAGRSYQDLAAQSPPLYFLDDDLNRGLKLLDYKILGEGQPRGTGYSYVVQLTFQDKNGSKSKPKKVAYSVVTEPKHAVTREDRQP